MPNKLSTTMISRAKGLDRDELFSLLERDGLIQRDSEGRHWLLTTKGAEIGGTYLTNDNDGSKYPVWPEDIIFPFESDNNLTDPTPQDMSDNQNDSSDMVNLKNILFNKDLDAFNNINYESLSGQNLENLILFNLIGDILKNGSIDLEKFTKSLWKMIFDNKIDIFDKSLMSLFPACKVMGPELSCEAFFWKLDEKHIKEILIKWRADKAQELEKTPSHILPDRIIASIIKQQPTEISALSQVDGLGQTRINNYGNDIIQICNNDSSDQVKVFLCRQRSCAEPKIIPREDTKYKIFNIYEWFRHYGISYRNTERPTEFDFPIKLAGYFNRLKELKEILDCKTCEGQMVPNWRYAKSYSYRIEIEQAGENLVNQSAAYRVTIFHCKNSACDEYEINYKISHCINCGVIIDSRIDIYQCEENMHICNECYGCCELHRKEERENLKVQIYCPDCGLRTIRIYENNRKRWSFCTNRECDHTKRGFALDRRFRQESYRNVFLLRNSPTTSLP